LKTLLPVRTLLEENELIKRMPLEQRETVLLATILPGSVITSIQMPVPEHLEIVLLAKALLPE